VKKQNILSQAQLFQIVLVLATSLSLGRPSSGLMMACLAGKWLPKIKKIYRIK
jgi:hypothetical protein